MGDCRTLLTHCRAANTMTAALRLTGSTKRTLMKFTGAESLRNSSAVSQNGARGKTKLDTKDAGHVHCPASHVYHDRCCGRLHIFPPRLSPSTNSQSHHQRPCPSPSPRHAVRFYTFTIAPLIRHRHLLVMCVCLGVSERAHCFRCTASHCHLSREVQASLAWTLRCPGLGSWLRSM